jgi:flagellar biosynthetic protein FlhB
MANGEGKTEKATPRRRQKVREEGNVPKSQELGSLAVLLGGFVFISIFFTKIWNDFLVASFKGIEIFINPERLNANDITFYWSFYLKHLILWIFILFLGAIVLVVIVNIAQFGFLFTFKPLQPKLSKLNPISGLKNLFFSLNSLFELVKNIVKIAVILAVAYFFFKNHLGDILTLYKIPLLEGISKLGALIYQLTLYIIAVGGIIGILDYAYRRWKWERDIMMTKWEVKEEHKQTEGNPEVKRELRRRMREIIMRRMIQQVPKATVVITNPTHFAVALKYDMDKDYAPKVVAKGADEIAKRIIEVAKEHGVEIYQDPPLARALYYSVDVGQEIPEKFYKAVAKVIAYVLKKKNQIKP